MKGIVIGIWVERRKLNGLMVGGMAEESGWMDGMVMSDVDGLSLCSMLQAMERRRIEKMSARDETCAPSILVLKLGHVEWQRKDDSATRGFQGSGGWRGWSRVGTKPGPCASFASQWSAHGDYGPLTGATLSFHIVPTATTTMRLLSSTLLIPLAAARTLQLHHRVVPNSGSSTPEWSPLGTIEFTDTSDMVHVSTTPEASRLSLSGASIDGTSSGDDREKDWYQVGWQNEDEEWIYGSTRAVRLFLQSVLGLSPYTNGPLYPCNNIIIRNSLTIPVLPHLTPPSRSFPARHPSHITLHPLIRPTLRLLPPKTTLGIIHQFRQSAH